MTQINRLTERIRRLNNGNTLLAMITDGDNRFHLNYYIDGRIKKHGTLYFDSLEQVYEKIEELKEEYRVFTENCDIHAILGADELE